MWQGQDFIGSDAEINVHAVEIFAVVPDGGGVQRFDPPGLHIVEGDVGRLFPAIGKRLVRVFAVEVGGNTEEERD